MYDTINNNTPFPQLFFCIIKKFGSTYLIPTYHICIVQGDQYILERQFYSYIYNSINQNSENSIRKLYTMK